jgi:hypothetical protein
MSRFQQIRVRVEPVYEKGLAKDFPRLYTLFCRLDPDLAKADPAPPLYDLVHYLVRLSQQTDLDPGVSQAINLHGQGIVDLRRKIEEAIGTWKLGQAEKLLNDLEDDFMAFEKDLPKELAKELA